MPRKGPARKRPIVNDPVYGSPMVTQLVNRVLLDGKKSTAERIVYGALEGVGEKSGQDPLTVLKRAMDNIRPSLEVRSRRVEAPPTRCPWRSRRVARRPSPCDGWSTTLASAARRP